MRRIVKQLLLLLLFTIISSNSFSQPILNDSIEAYDYWAKRGIIEMVYASMQDYLATVDSGKFAQENQTVKDYKKKFLLSIENKNEVDLNNNFDTIVQFLKSNYWSGIATKVCIPLIVNQKKKLQLDDQFFSINSSNNKNKNWNQKKEYILKSYQRTLDSLVKTSNEIVIDDISTNKTENIDSKIDIFSERIIVNLLFLLVGVLIGGLFVFLYSKFKIESILSTEKIDYKNELKNSDQFYFFGYIGIVKILHQSKNKKKKEVLMLKTEIDNLKNPSISKNDKFKQPNNLANSITNSNRIELDENKVIKLEQENVPNNVIEWKVDQEMKPTNILYFTIPEADGSFKNVNGKNIKEIDCFYKIEIEKNNQKGKLSFLSSEFDSRALDNIDYYLNPVCEIENISDRTYAKKINVVNFGTVVLIGDTWKIESNKKLKIRLI